MKSAMNRAGVFSLAMAVQGFAYGEVIKIEFDVTINKKTNQWGYSSEPFLPIEHQYASLTFDNTLSSVDRNWQTPNTIFSHVWSVFGVAGQTKILSPVENVTTINPLSGAPVVESAYVKSFLNYQLAPSDYRSVSFAHYVSAYSTMDSVTHTNGPHSYEGESWSRSAGIGSPIEYVGPVDEAGIYAYTFTSNDLMAYLHHMKDTRTAFSFSDGFTYSSRPSLASYGTYWSGPAIITNIIYTESVAIPEPGSLALLCVALAGLVVTRRRKA